MAMMKSFLRRKSVDISFNGRSNQQMSAANRILTIILERKHSKWVAMGNGLNAGGNFVQ